MSDEETVTARGGQTLVRVRRPVGRPRKNPLPEQAGQPAAAEVAAAPAPAASPSPSPSQRSRPPPELVTPFDEIPPEEDDPRLRDQATIGTIELTEHGKGFFPRAPAEAVPDFVAATDQPRTLDDLFAMFPVGDGTGQYYLHVERKQPAAFHGTATKGVLRRVRRAMTFEEFRGEYGGGVYELIAYGPPKRGGVMNEMTGTVFPKPLTKPVRMTIPFHVNGGWPPNPDAAFDSEDQEEEPMQNHHGGMPFPRTATPAHAQMYKTGLEHEERRESRRRDEVRERRRRDADVTSSAIGVIADASTRREEQLMRQNESLRQELREMRDAPKNDFDGLSKVMQAMAPPRATQSELEALRETHRREIADIERRHASDLENIERRAREERTQLIQIHKGDMERADSRVRDAEQRANDRVRDVELRLDQAMQRGKEDVERVRQDLGVQHTRELEMLRNENARTIDAMRTNYETRLSSEARSWEREIATRAEVHDSKIVTERTRLETQVEQLKAELRRRDGEVKDLKELAAKNKDLGRLIDEARKTAELLGYSPKDEGGEGAAEPPDFKTMMMGILTEGAKRLPEILKSAGDAAAAVRHGPGQQQGPAQQHPGMQQVPHPAYAPQPRMQPPRAFATENDEQTSYPQFFEPGVGVRPPPLSADLQAQQMRPMAPPPVAAPPPAAAQAAGAPALTGPMAPPDQQPAAPQPPPAVAPSVAPPPPVAAAAAPAAVEGNPAYDAIVLNLRPEMETWYENNVPPAEIAKAVVERHGAVVVKQMLPTLSSSVVTGALKRAGAVDSPLLGRRGRRYVTSIEEAVRSLVQ